MRGLGVVFLSVIILVFAVSAFANKSHGSVMLDSGLKISAEEDCVDNFGNRTCTETTYVSCNGEEYRIPAPTGFAVYRSVVEKEYVEKCSHGVPNNKEVPSPKDRISESEIHVMSDRVIIDIQNPGWRRYIDSNSMDPFIDEGTTTIEIRPETEKEVQVGDIIAYNTDEAEYTLVHRVVAIESDESGTYFLTKGDNYFRNDNYKVRFSEIEGIVVGILY